MAVKEVEKSEEDLVFFRPFVFRDGKGSKEVKRGPCFFRPLSSVIRLLSSVTRRVL